MSPMMLSVSDATTVSISSEFYRRKSEIHRTVVRNSIKFYSPTHYTCTCIYSCVFMRNPSYGLFYSDTLMQKVQKYLEFVANNIKCPVGRLVIIKRSAGKFLPAGNALGTCGIGYT